MIEIEVKDLLSGKLDDFDDLFEHHIYVFRDGDTILYVGKADNVDARLWEHK